MRLGWSQPVVIVEIGNDYLKVAEVSGNRKARVALTKLAGINGPLENAVRDSARRLGAAGGKAIISLPRHLVTVRFLELPATEPEEVAGMISLQIGKQTPYSRDEILYAWYGTPSASSGYSRVMLVIAMRNVVQERIDILERAGLRVESVALGTEGLAEWFRSLERQQSREGEAEILLDVDSGYSELLVFRQGEIVFTRNIMLGANHLNEAPQKWQERMVREVGHALKLYSTEDRETLVAHVFVGGAEKYRREIAEIIDARLEIDATAVVDGDEAELIVADAMEREDAEQSCSRSVLLGLGRKGGTSLDLLPPEHRLRHRMVENRKSLTVMGALTISSVAVLLLLLATRFYSLSFYREELQGRISDIKNISASVDRMRRGISMVESRLDMRGRSLPLLAEIHRLLPEEIYVTRLQLEERGNVVIRGKAKAMSHVFTFVTTLEKSALFENVKATRTTKRRQNQGEYADFEISCQHESRPVPLPDPVADNKPKSEVVTVAEGVK